MFDCLHAKLPCNVFDTLQCQSLSQSGDFDQNKKSDLLRNFISIQCKSFKYIKKIRENRSFDNYICHFLFDSWNFMQKVNFTITFKDYIQLLYPYCVNGVIFSSEGDIWSSTENWVFTPENGKEIAKLMEKPQEAMKSKLKLGQRDYLIVYADDHTLVARKREFGVMVKHSKTYYILGTCNEKINPTKCLEYVTRVANMMKMSSRSNKKDVFDD